MIKSAHATTALVAGHPLSVQKLSTAVRAIGCLRIAYVLAWLMVIVTQDVCSALQVQNDTLEGMHTSVTVDLTNTTLTDVLSASFKAAGVDYHIPAGAESVARSVAIDSIHMDHMPLRMVIIDLLVNTRFDFDIKNGTWFVDLTSGPIIMQNVTPRDLIRRIFAQAGVPYVFWERTPSNRRVSMSLKSMPFQEVLERTMEVTRPEAYLVQWVSGVCVISPNVTNSALPAGFKPIVDFNFQDVAAQSAITALCRSGYSSYFILSPVEGRVNVPQQDGVDLEQALKKVLKAVKGNSGFKLLRMGSMSIDHGYLFRFGAPSTADSAQSIAPKAEPRLSRR